MKLAPTQSPVLTQPVLTQEEAFARIRLLRSPSIGPVSYAQLLRRFGAAASALEGLPDLGKRGRLQYAPVPAAKIEAEINAVRKARAIGSTFRSNIPTCCANWKARRRS